MSGQFKDSDMIKTIPLFYAVSLFASFGSMLRFLLRLSMKKTSIDFPLGYAMDSIPERTFIKCFILIRLKIRIRVQSN